MQAVNDNEFQNKLDKALQSLKERPATGRFSGFERAVWSEIAIRGTREDGRRFRWFVGDPGSPRISIGIACGMLAIIAGAALGFLQAEAYGKEASLSLEQRYVESIHPVLMSSHHDAGQP